MQNPRNLLVADKARALASETYRVTAGFPKSERFGLTAQMRRAAVSIGSNIWEGCGRRTDRELTAFLHIALGSAAELEFQCLVAADVGLASDEQLCAVRTAARQLGAMLSRLIVGIRQPRRPQENYTVSQRNLTAVASNRGSTR